VYLYRVLNDFDMTIDPIKNGIASKQMIYDATRRYLYNTERDKMNSMSNKDRDLYIKEYMNKYLINHRRKLNKIFNKKHIGTRNTIHRFVEDKDNFAYCSMIKDLSSLPNHLINGSRSYTNWISATDNFDGIWNYYDRQSIHQVAVLDVCTNGVFDENTYVVDLSERDTIERIKFISNRIDDDTFESFINLMREREDLREDIVSLFNRFIMNPTNKRFMGFNFAAKSNEYCLYEYINKESIVGVLESLQIDLICADLFNDDYLLLSPGKQKEELERLKNMILKHVREENNPYMLYVFDELYLKRHNIDDITDNIFDREKMILMRNEIISKSQNLPNVLIKRR